MPKKPVIRGDFPIFSTPCWLVARGRVSRPLDGEDPRFDSGHVHDMRKEIRELIEWACANGFTNLGPARRGGHIKLRHTSGRIVTVDATPSDWRWRHNTIRDICRVAGIPKPRPDHLRRKDNADMGGTATEDITTETPTTGPICRDAD